MAPVIGQYCAKAGLSLAERRRVPGSQSADASRAGDAQLLHGLDQSEV